MRRARRRPAGVTAALLAATWRRGSSGSSDDRGTLAEVDELTPPPLGPARTSVLAGDMAIASAIAVEEP